MTRGGQRERDREKTQAKLAAKGTGGKTGNPLARNESDSAALAAKVAKKEAQKKEEASNLNGANVKIVRKKGIRKEDAGLDDLLSAGLKPGKK